METAVYEIMFFPSPIGKLALCADAFALRNIFFDSEASRLPANCLLSKKNTVLLETAEQLNEYFEGRRKVFSVPLYLAGTEFQRRVWLELVNVPYGETRSYKDIARAVGNDKAVRAVGGANNKNPIPVIVPCHRIIGSDAKLTGYRGGLGIKEKLLELENKHK